MEKGQKINTPFQVVGPDNWVCDDGLQTNSTANLLFCYFDPREEIDVHRQIITACNLYII